MKIETSPLPLRRQVYPLLITVALAILCARILATIRNYEPNLFRPDSAQGADPREARPVWPKTRPEPVPTFSSNDRSRWATIRALVDHGTYVIGYRDIDPETGKYKDSGIIFEDGWGSVDKVLRPEPDPENPNRLRFYSSKPPIFPTLVAGEYWLLQKLFGWSLAEPDGRWSVIRVTLVTVNVLPLLIYLLLLVRLVERHGTTDWGRLFVITAAAFGTLVTTFGITLNNHTVAACTTLFALVPALRVWREGTEAPAWSFLLAGFFAAFTGAIELPATSFSVAVVLLLLWRVPMKSLLILVPAAAVPVAGFFLTNQIALDRWKPAYGEFGGPWYEYEGSHWKANPGKEKRGIDWAGEKESRAVYAFHLLLGHHGLFALTPILFFAVVGMGRGAVRIARNRGSPARELVGNGKRNGLLPEQARPEGEPSAAGQRTGEYSAIPDEPPHTPIPELACVAALTLVLTVVVIGFYLVKTTNYGGWSNGPRWLFWLTPLWLLTMLPVVDGLAARRWGRVLGLVLLGISVLSASYRDWNPWRHPWIYEFMDWVGWIPY
ncbi:MAG: hypothetical protein K2R98_01890 [Gemmataceae bacterium]|nr:hypothetical protein [Gemmataceae bacterium]